MFHNEDTFDLLHINCTWCNTSGVIMDGNLLLLEEDFPDLDSPDLVFFVWSAFDLMLSFELSSLDSVPKLY